MTEPAALLDRLPLSRKQLDYVVNSTATVNLAEGSIRSGKTVASLFRWLLFIANAPTTGALIMVGRTIDSIGRNALEVLQDPAVFGPWAAATKYTPGANRAVILGRVVYVLGANNRDSEKVVRGLTVCGAYVDELTVVVEPFFKQLLGRMSVDGARMFATTNPDTPAHWVRTQYLDDLAGHPDWRSWSFVMRDNPTLSAERLAFYERMYTGLWHRRFILGQWVAADGAVFEHWDADRMTVDTLPTITRWLGTGIDYGTSNPFVALVLGAGVDGRLYLTHEWRHDGRATRRSMTDYEYSAALRSWWPTLPTPGTTELGVRSLSGNSGGEYVVVDPSAASFREQLFRDGVQTIPGANEVADGIRTLHSLMGRGAFRVHRSCTGFLSEVTGYSWDENATKTGKDAPVKEADHCLIAGTMVRTEHGEQPIEAVKVGTLVATRTGWRPVTAAWCTSPAAETVTVTLSNGRTLTGTPDHRVWTENRGWTHLSALTPTDTPAPATAPVRVLAVAPGLVRPVYDLTVAGAHEFYASGILVHNSIDAARYIVHTTRTGWAPIIREATDRAAA